MRSRLLLLLALSLGGFACSRSRAEVVRPVDAPVSLNVVNNNALPVVINIASAGTNQRLGTVHPGMSTRFTIPPNFVGGQSVEFLVRNDAGGAFRSGAFLLVPGEIIDMTVAAQMFSSTAVLRP
jgi:hypothetical protein